MKTSEILKLARPLLKGYGFICHAVEATEALGVEWKDIVNLRGLVQGRLEGHYTLEMWLAKKHGITRQSMNMTYEQHFDKLYETRLTWVDSLIAEFAAIGD